MSYPKDYAEHIASMDALAERMYDNLEQYATRPGANPNYLQTRQAEIDQIADFINRVQYRENVAYQIAHAPEYQTNDELEINYLRTLLYATLKNLYGFISPAYPDHKIMQMVENLPKGNDIRKNHNINQLYHEYQRQQVITDMIDDDNNIPENQLYTQLMEKKKTMPFFQFLKYINQKKSETLKKVA